MKMSNSNSHIIKLFKSSYFQICGRICGRANIYTSFIYYNYNPYPYHQIQNSCQSLQDPPSKEAFHISMIGPLVTPAATAFFLGVDWQQCCQSDATCILSFPRFKVYSVQSISWESWLQTNDPNVLYVVLTLPLCNVDGQVSNL